MPVGLILTIGAVTAILLVVVVLFAQAAFYYADESQIQKKVIARPFTELEQIRSTQLSKLNQPPHFVDKEKGIVQLPIDMAMKIYLEKQGKNAGGAAEH